MSSLPVLAHVNLENPKGGETFTPGESVKIEWQVTVQHNSRNWDLYFSYDGGSTYEIIESDIEVEVTSFGWIVPSRASHHARIKIVQDNSGADYSDESGDFVISGSTTDAIRQSVRFDIIISPNPTINRFKIKTTAPRSLFKSILVTNENGKEMKRFYPDRSDWNMGIVFNVNDWPSGIYFVFITTNQGIEERKLVVL